MKYISCEKPGKLKIGEKNVPKREDGEALLRITKVGVCGTDLHAFQGNQPFFTYPRILGHELAAVIEEIDTNTKGLSVGDKVVIMPYISCGVCIACRKEKANCCTNIRVLGVHSDGGMQEFISVSTELLLEANQLDDNQIAIVEPLAIGAHALHRANIKSGETVMIIGCGPIGLGLMKLATRTGATVIAMDINAERLAYAKDKIGVEHVINARFEPLEELKKITRGDLAEVVFDATGSKAALEVGVKYMSHGGRYVLIGLSKSDLTFNHPYIHSKEATLMCSRNATIKDFRYVMDVMKQGEFPIDSYITHQVYYSEMINHFKSWTKSETGVIKAMVDFSGVK